MTPSFPPVVLQAGGKGQRMLPAAGDLPKVLVPVQGVPLLERLVRQLAGEGARRFYIIVGHAADRVEAHVDSMKDLPAYVNIQFVRETEPRGNVGALADLDGLHETVLFAFGDLLTTVRFRELWERHREGGDDITLTSHFESHRLQLGHLIVDGDAVMDYREKPEYQFLICSGIAAIEPAVRRCMPRSGSVGMNRMVLAAIENRLRVAHWTHGAFWMDVNTPELLAKANTVQIPDTERSHAGA